MKCSEFSKLLDEIPKLCTTDASSNAMDELAAVRQILTLTPNITVLSATKQLYAYKNGIVESSSRGLLVELAAFLELFGKPAIAKDAAAISDLLGRLDGKGIRLLADRATIARSTAKKPANRVNEAPVRHELVARYSRLLEQSLGDDPGFSAVVAELESDKSITGSEYAALSKSFCLKVSKTKAAALKNIRARHQNLMIARAKSAATAGRIAG